MGVLLHCTQLLFLKGELPAQRRYARLAVYYCNVVYAHTISRVVIYSHRADFLSRLHNMNFIYSIIWLIWLIDTRCLRAQTSSLKFEEEPESIVKDIEHGSGETVSVRLACRINGVQATHTVEWWKNGERISRNGSLLPGHNMDWRYSPRSNGTNYDLEIVPVAEYNAWKDEGSYKCRVFDDASNSILLTSRIATVTIRRLPRAGHPVCEVVDATASQATVVEGEEVNMICWSDQGVPVVGLKYFRNGKELRDCSSRLTNDGKAIHSCEFTVSKDDADADFVCMMVYPDSESPTDRKCALKINVLYEPTVNIQPAGYSITDRDDSVTFYCDVDANPPVLDSPIWTFDGAIVKDGVSYKIGGSGWTLTVSNMYEQENGDHFVSCILQNSRGYSSFAARLIVSVSPVMVPTHEAPVTPTVPSVANTSPSTLQSDTWKFIIAIVLSSCACLIVGVFMGVGLSISVFKVRLNLTPNSTRPCQTISQTIASGSVDNENNNMYQDIDETETRTKTRDSNSVNDLCSYDHHEQSRRNKPKNEPHASLCQGEELRYVFGATVV